MRIILKNVHIETIELEEQPDGAGLDLGAMLGSLLPDGSGPQQKPEMSIKYEATVCDSEENHRNSFWARYIGFPVMVTGEDLEGDEVMVSGYITDPGRPNFRNPFSGVNASRFLKRP